ncbi:MAG TPA: hypothetical protein VJK03_05220 [Candidatus Nanoarchaeia archaeon]|nr:hypothetical protein [Candidatus Nanoarchaeia archaeon]
MPKRDYHDSLIRGRKTVYVDEQGKIVSEPPHYEKRKSKTKLNTYGEIVEEDPKKEGGLENMMVIITVSCIVIVSLSLLARITGNTTGAINAATYNPAGIYALIIGALCFLYLIKKNNKK